MWIKTAHKKLVIGELQLKGLIREEDGAGERRVIVTGSILYNLVECPHRVSLDAFGSPADRDVINPFVRLLWERGSLLADLAESRQEDKQSFLEEGRDRAVEIGRFGEIPKLFDNLGRSRGRKKEIRYEPEALAHFAVERAQHTQRGRCKAIWIALTVLRSFDDLPC